MQKTNFKTLDLCMIGVVTAVIVIMAQISIPMPLGVPMTMQTFAITLAGIILGSKKRSCSFSHLCAAWSSWCSRIREL